MPIQPAEIQQKKFASSRHGYEPKQVDEFLAEITADYEQLLLKIADLKMRLTTAESKNTELSNQLEAAKAAVAKAQAQVQQAQSAAASAVAEPAAAPRAKGYAATEDEISATLILAKQTADRIVNDANSKAEHIRADANANAQKIIRQAQEDRQAELKEIERLKKSREDFRKEYMSLIQKFMEAAQTNFPSSMLSSSMSGSEASRTSVATRIPNATPFGARAETPVDDLD